MTGTKRWRKPALYSMLVVAVAALAVVAITGEFPRRVEAAGNSVAALNQLSDAFAQVSEDASPAVVFIRVEMETRGQRMPQGWQHPNIPNDLYDFFFSPRAPQRQAPQRQGPRGPQGRQAPRHVPYGQGTGFIFSEDGYIVTNHHVVGDADRIQVTLSDGREMEAELVGSDPKTEIAVIKVDEDNLPSVPLGDSDALRVGEWVLAIGNPFGLSHTVTAGIVSARGRGEVGITDYSDYIQTDAAINPGNSGGPLLNLEGKVVGMNTAIVSRSGGYMGIGLAIPINMVKFVADQLMENGEIRRGFLGVGIQNVTQDLADWFDLKDGKGVLISEVMEDSPAERAGIERDDIVVEFDGQPAEEVQSFRSRVASTTPGKRVPIVVIRGGKRVTKHVKIGTLDEETQRTARTPGGVKTDLGLSVQNLTDELAERFGYEGESGVIVSQVEPNSPAAAAGIETGMLIQEVNREAVRNTRDFEDALGNGERDAVLLLVSDGQFSRYVALKSEER